MQRIFVLSFCLLALACIGCASRTLGQVCHAHKTLPDAACTPGAVDTHVAQSNIRQTICVRGYTAKVRPPVAYTNALKRTQIKQYGYADSRLQAYEEDHLISLELGGSPRSIRNLWPEPIGEARTKDVIENLLHTEVCSGLLSLKAAQHAISTDWTSAVHASVAQAVQGR